MILLLMHATCINHLFLWRPDTTVVLVGGFVFATAAYGKHGLGGCCATYSFCRPQMNWAEALARAF